MSWVKGDGAKIIIVFTEPLTGTVTGNESCFTVTVPEYSYVPGGMLRDVLKAVYTTSAGNTANELILEMKPLERFESAAGDITVAYSGAGILAGEGGSVAAFTQTFTPSDLVPKPDQNDSEHIIIAGITALGTLKEICYSGAYTGGEHVEVISIVATGILTNINNL